MNGSVLGHLIQEQTSLDTILHFTTRGRNLMRIYYDLLGAHALDVRNLFILAGDPGQVGDYPIPDKSMTISPSGLIRLIKQGWNQGKDHEGNSIGQPTRFFVGCALDPYASNIDTEANILHKKVEAGADFCLTQMLFDPAPLEIFLRRYEQLY